MLKAGNRDQLPRSLPRARFSNDLLVTVLLVFIVIAQATNTFSQTRIYPKEIRGYKVERTVVEVKKPGKSRKSDNATTQAGNNSGVEPNRDGPAGRESDAESNVDALIKFGKPQLARITPLGITFEVPIVVSPVTQSGRVDFLVFEDMVVNGSSVEIGEYHRTFDLPNKDPLTLRDPLRFYIYLPSAMLAAIGEWSDSKETWPVTGRVYVFGRFKKSIFSFKRCIPVELNLSMRNPLREP